MNTFRTRYTKEEIAEVTSWFRERMDRLPKELQLHESTHTANLRFTVESLIALAPRSENNACFSGYMHQLFSIRQLLQAQGME